jgi:hypothetical protein
MLYLTLRFFGTAYLRIFVSLTSPGSDRRSTSISIMHVAQARRLHRKKTSLNNVTEPPDHPGPCATSVLAPSLSNHEAKPLVVDRRVYLLGKMMAVLWV